MRVSLQNDYCSSRTLLQISNRSCFYYSVNSRSIHVMWIFLTFPNCNKCSEIVGIDISNYSTSSQIVSRGFAFTVSFSTSSSRAECYSHSLSSWRYASPKGYFANHLFVVVVVTSCLNYITLKFGHILTQILLLHQNNMQFIFCQYNFRLKLRWLRLTNYAIYWTLLHM